MASTTDPLPSWHDSAVKKQIIEFVTQTTTPGSDDFIAVADRIATFDNDCTLWSEKPIYLQVYFAMDRVKAMADQHPEWKTTEPFASTLKGDVEALSAQGLDGIMKLVMASHGNMTTEAFHQAVRDWLKTAKHPTTGKPYTDMVYQPMLELLDYLRENDYQPFIISGGGIEFMRVWAPEVYQIPTENIVGTTLKTEYKIIDGKPAIQRLSELDFVNDKSVKPVTIQNYIGKRPVMAFGNSDGDMQMLQWTKAGPGPRLSLIIHHTDDKREWAYDKDSSVGRLDKSFEVGQKEGWLFVDMKNDWKTIYKP
ncbi:HAD family hydrolase [Photobacterium atrarenae]|uniref:Haloacid dehalogenase-like hydrolase n=1 Tax=Photobacterium atrarenae TaxID=865757 RepID=A0ABY5GKK7_9GAMM|nr:HAD family hydrolase [Photobacterium atrarenae]UTV29654.1 haloacid dehalogenase-like hydrolase [Photobacterium atrarenae]